VGTLTLGGGGWQGLTAEDVGDIVQVVSTSGSPAVTTVLWTTIASVTNSSTCVLAETIGDCTGAQAVVYRPLDEVINNPLNYILQDSIVFETSITTRPTLDFTTFTGDRTLIPVVGMPVLMTDAMLDGSVSTYTITGGSGYAAGDYIAVLQEGVRYPCIIQVDGTTGGGAIGASHIVLTPTTGVPGGFMYSVANGLTTEAITGSGSGATVDVTAVTGPAFGAEPGDVFGGSIEQVKIYNYPGMRQLKCECQCVSWDAILNRRVLGLTPAFPVSSTTLSYNGGQQSNGYSPVYGYQRWFNLGSPPPVAIIEVTLNGTPQSVGPATALPPVGAGGFEWYWSFGSFQLYEDPSGPTLTDGDAVVITIQSVQPQAPNVTYQNQPADQIVEAVISYIQDSEGITLANIVGSITESPLVPVPTVNSITFLANQTVDEALSSLMTYINDGSTNFWYYLDPRKGLHFEILGITTAAPWNISEADGSDGNVQSMVSALTTREKYANAAWINSQGILPAVTQVFSGNSEATTFNVSYPVGSQPTILFGAGLPNPLPSAYQNPPAPYVFGSVTYPETQTVGVLGDSGFQWYWDAGSNTITQDGSYPPISDTEAIWVTYNPDIGQISPYPNPTSIPDSTMIARQQVEGGSGEYDLTIDLTDQLPFTQGSAGQSAAVKSIAQTLAEYFQNMAQEVEVDSYRPGLAPGQSIIIGITGVAGA
jgi:hypothetical protein